MIRSVLFASVAALVMAATAQAAPLNLGTTNTSNAPTTLTGNTAGAELKVVNANATNSALWGMHAGTTGTGPAVRGDSASTTASAFSVYGLLSSTSPGAGSAAVRGRNNGTNAKGFGVWGSHAGAGFGVYGTSAKGKAVYGLVTTTAPAPGSAGVYGESKASNGNGVQGVANSGSAAYGVYGQSSSGFGVYGTGLLFGVSGSSAVGSGVRGVGGSKGVEGIGTSYNGSGVLGEANSGTGASGVRGTSTTGYGGSFAGPSGVNSVSTAGGGGTAAVLGESHGTNGNGVVGSASVGANAYGVEGYSTTGYAGYFVGNVYITGTCTGCTGPDRLDHPLSPARMYLQHAPVESSDMKNVYDGVVVTDRRGLATVRMPRWFQALNRSFRYQLTIVGRSFAQAIVWTPMARNRFTIRTNEPRVRVSWQVTGIRHDRYASTHPMKVELPKRPADRATYVHPGAFGKPRSSTVGWKPLRKAGTP